MIDQLLPEGWVTGAVHEVRLPTYVKVSNRQTKACNLNEYRNLHHHHLNKQKTNFQQEVSTLLAPLPRMQAVWLHYTIFKPRNGRLDTMNVGSIVDKYLSDALVAEGKIPDDDHDHVIFNSFSFGGLARMDGHAIVKIIELIPRKEDNMRILLDQDDIQKALDAYAATLNLGQPVTGVEISVNDDEIEAELLMGESQSKPKRRVGRPKKETANADADSQAGGSGNSKGTDSTGSESETAQPEKETTNNPSRGGETESSDSETTTSETPAEASDDPKPVTKKKSSIFDVD